MKFERPNSNIVPFGTNANENKRFAFGTNNYTNDINENLNDSFKLGWETVGINSKPPRQWFNGLAYASTYLTSYLFQAGIPEWNDKQKYYINSIAMGSDGNIYKSLVGTEEIPNVNNNPTLAGSVSWKSILSDYALINGDETKKFKVADAEEDDEAVNLKQLNEASMDINTLPDKPIPENIDNLVLQESGGVLKKLTWANLKATLLTYFDTFYSRTTAIFGIGQTWQNVTASRVVGVTYTNTTGKAIMANISMATASNGGVTDFYINGVKVSTQTTAGNTATATIEIIILNNSTYRIEYSSSTISSWFELR